MAPKNKTHVLHFTALFTQYRPRDSFMTSAAKKVYGFLDFTSKFGIEQYEPVGAPKRARNRLFSQYHAQYPEHERKRIILCSSIIVDELVQGKSKLRIIFRNGLDKSSTRHVIHIGGRTLWKNISKKLVEQGEMACQRELICFLRATACNKPQKIKIALLLHTGRL